MATPAKTAGTSLIAWQDVATANVALSSAQDVSTKLGATFFCKVARRSGSAFTAGWPNIRIEASGKASGTDDWIPLVTFQPVVGATIANTTLSGAVSAGATTFGVAAATNIAAGDLLYLGDTSSANWELVRVKSVVTTTVTPEEAVTYAHANAAAVTDQAEVYVATIDLTSVSRVRAVIDNAGSGQTAAFEVLMTTFDSIS